MSIRSLDVFIRKYILAIVILGFTYALFSSPVFSNELTSFRLSPKPFSTRMCKKIHPDQEVRIQASHHRDLVLRIVRGQYFPQDHEEARKKAYVHYISLTDLTDSQLIHGAVAFDEKHAVIFHSDAPNGISRREFTAQLPFEHQAVAEQGLNTFLRLHPIFNAAIDACRPYPSQVTYETNDEIDKIEIGRLAFRTLVQSFNKNVSPAPEWALHERGISEGFFNPNSSSKHISYQALNPLNFYIPDSMLRSP